MRKQLLAADIKAMLFNLSKDISDAEHILTELDSAIGDGDLGMTLIIGFREIEKYLKNTSSESISEILKDCADAFSEKAASTFATLLTIMLKSAGKEAASYTAIETREAASMLNAAVAAVQKRGGAKLGDKTLLDALIPAAEVLTKAAAEKKELPEAVQLSLAAAQAGAENTVQLKAKVGRSGYLGDRTVGQKDPGAAAVVIILQSFTQYIC